LARIISIANQKGGVGKTTTAVNLAASLAAAEWKTLLIDIDPQGNASSGVGVFKDLVKMNIYDVFVDNASLSEVVYKTSLPYLFLVPANQDLIGFEVEFVAREGRETILKQILMKFEEDFDFIIIDCPPSLGLLTLNSLTACDCVLIPLQCEYYALEGLSALLHTIKLVRENLNPKLEIEGIVLTMYDGRNNLSRQVVEDVTQHFRDLMYDAIIPRNVRLSESPSHGKPILLYDAHSTGAKSYLQLTKEFLNRQKKAQSLSESKGP
jgi:chromosome partitioning protein